MAAHTAQAQLKTLHVTYMCNYTGRDVHMVQQHAIVQVQCQEKLTTTCTNPGTVTCCKHILQHTPGVLKYSFVCIAFLTFVLVAAYQQAGFLTDIAAYTPRQLLNYLHVTTSGRQPKFTRTCDHPDKIYRKCTITHASHTNIQSCHWTSFLTKIAAHTAQTQLKTLHVTNLCDYTGRNAHMVQQHAIMQVKCKENLMTTCTHPGTVTCCKQIL
jgi:hypothetical protein